MQSTSLFAGGKIESWGKAATCFRRNLTQVPPHFQKGMYLPNWPQSGGRGAHAWEKGGKNDAECHLSQQGSSFSARTWHHPPTPWVPLERALLNANLPPSKTGHGFSISLAARFKAHTHTLKQTRHTSLKHDDTMTMAGPSCGFHHGELGPVSVPTPPWRGCWQGAERYPRLWKSRRGAQVPDLACEWEEKLGHLLMQGWPHTQSSLFLMFCF